MKTVFIEALTIHLDSNDAEWYSRVPFEQWNANPSIRDFRHPIKFPLQRDFMCKVESYKGDSYCDAIVKYIFSFDDSLNGSNQQDNIILAIMLYFGATHVISIIQKPQK